MLMITNYTITTMYSYSALIKTQSFTRRIIQNNVFSILSRSNYNHSIPRHDHTLDTNVAKTNWLITNLTRQGKTFEARKLFDDMPERDVVTWTTVISGYIKCGMINEARKIFDRNDALKNVVTWTAMVSGYIRLNKVNEAEKLFREMPIKNVVSWNTMIIGYVQSGRIDKALALFEKMGERNVVSWNTVITALANCGRIEEARNFFEDMPKRDVISWTAMVTGFTKNGMVDEARSLFDRMPERNVVSWNAMIAGYAQNLRLDDAFELFEMMPDRDLGSWNTMITGFIQNRDLARAKQLFNNMPGKNVVSWTTMISGYLQDGQNEEALQLFSKMLANDEVAKPNEGTFVSVLSACSNLASLNEGQQVHQRIMKTIYQNSGFVVSSLINMYSKCGELTPAKKIFDDGKISHKDLISWNGMIAAYAHHGAGREAIILFEKMRKSGFKPNDVTYVGLLSACSHTGLIEMGLKYFNELISDTAIKVREDHYACLVDLCGRAGRLKDALGFIQRLGKNASALIWGALLNGCNVHRNTDIGKVAAKRIMELEPNCTSTYLLLSNLYASKGKWREALKVRSKMNEDGLKKQPGCSWIEVENRVHVFVVGDKSDSQFEDIYCLIINLHLNMKKHNEFDKV